VLDSTGRGRLLKYDPATGRVDTLLCGLHFANGVQFIDTDRTILLVVETTRVRILRVDISKLELDQTGTVASLMVSVKKVRSGSPMCY